MQVVGEGRLGGDPASQPTHGVSDKSAVLSYPVDARDAADCRTGRADGSLVVCAREPEDLFGDRWPMRQPIGGEDHVRTQACVRP